MIPSIHRCSSPPKILPMIPWILWNPSRLQMAHLTSPKSKSRKGESEYLILSFLSRPSRTSSVVGRKYFHHHSFRSTDRWTVTILSELVPSSPFLRGNSDFVFHSFGKKKRFDCRQALRVWEFEFLARAWERGRRALAQVRGYVNFLPSHLCVLQSLNEWMDGFILSCSLFSGQMDSVHPRTEQ